MFRAISLSSIPNAQRFGLQSVFVFGLTFWNLGCADSGPQAEFKLRSTTKDLITVARNAVKKTLDEDFGTPQKLVAWDRFPVNYSAGKGVVASVADDQSIVVTVDGDATRIRSGAPIFWVSGALASDKPGEGKIGQFNSETNHLVLDGTAKPAVGDKFVVGFGENLQMGRQVYMRNCMHCHGVAGDGAGPTGEFLNPRPRDYRSGVFKFTSTKPTEKPTRDDLERIVKYGIPGTYMPSFLLIGEHETGAVVEYVRWLAIRGEFEKRLTGELTNDYSQAAINEATTKANAAYAEKLKKKEAAEKPLSPAKALKAAATEFAKYAKEDLPAAIDENSNTVAEAWTRAQEPETVVVPSIQRVDDTTESRERGRLLFLSDKTKCYTCHGPTGRGDGGANEDFWPKPGTSEKYPNRGLHDEWGMALKPRNLTLGQYRGGRRPVDIFRRMYSGIKGTPMPAFGGTALKDNEIWDLVNYVMSLPYTSKQASPAPMPGHVVKLDDKQTH